MNAEVNQTQHGSGKGIAFLVGAIFNVMASINFNRVLEHALIALIGGIIWLLFQILANRILKGGEPKLKLKVKKQKKERVKESNDKD
jgi:hypothetical protein